MESENFISGIYNFCDRWCEKCELSYRCKLFADEQEEVKEVKNSDDFNEIISKCFQKTIAFIYEIVSEKGIDFNEVVAYKNAEISRKKSFNELKKQPIVESSISYSKKVHQFLKENNYFEHEKSNYIRQIEMEIEVEKNEKSLKTINESLNIINWYQFQISVKLTSAFRYFPHDSDFEDEIQNMHHAAAKIALIGIENSIKAWHCILEIADAIKEDFILNIFIQLVQLKKNIFKQFPLIDEFKRPGFDNNF
ncbi:MAG: hypothetical protein GW772_09205 [Flavobacteriia bacterium]|nr:hypothetical protein [Flavobacteriia bacterium]OIP46287.1 MAG: hypothetical protein AUK46_08685 [Flavobacteriaceae bacterium CG2_30_31_66]PIV95933.1 MAG: hypothetical protein COW43_10750 [Flavobacteriaceae bacterium CG17_big_fil_post_rev_8_21_14_2_50_31_13]PIX13518.1 MAG: hypothetical protein COZ74_05795 [Flavobacteriaceae bacterium CG_4_8_14_3_um_filter_31_8]PIY16268.1 MAG: hypothetical protein COZ16_00460 [Flavobacteriaceae bacterium CG_4_10_14_3_um_filter_31_253]PIZ11930.1 MAG: hypotheti